MVERHLPLQPGVIGRLVVVGLGLIGGSFAKGARASGLCTEVVGVDLDLRSCERAVELGVIDRYETDLSAACAGAAVIQLAVPILAMERLLTTLAGLEMGNAVLTDVGSAKGSIVRAARAAFAGDLPRFVPGHPIAGSEQSGVEAANAALFSAHKVILTPLPETDADALAVVDRLWRALGADVEHMDVERHDEVLAATSHLPHLLAFGLVDSLAKRNENLEIFRYAAGGFRDFTRIAGSDPTMWHDIFLANRDAVLRTLDTFRGDLDELRGALQAGDGQQLRQVFTRARAAREHFGELLAQNARARAGSRQWHAGAAKPLSGATPLPVQFALLNEAQRPGDASVAVAMLVAASIAQGSALTLQHVGGSPALSVAIELLQQMGADIVVDHLVDHEGRPVADVQVRAAALHGVSLSAAQVALLVDEWPVLLVAAACAKGETLLGGGPLPATVHNRLHPLLEALQALGVTCVQGTQGLALQGIGQQPLSGAHVHSQGDPRVVLVFIAAALRASAPIVIDDGACAAVAFPGFLGLCAEVGLPVVEEGAS